MPSAPGAPALPEPVVIPAARFRRSDVGGAARSRAGDRRKALVRLLASSVQQASSNSRLTANLKCECSIRSNGDDGWRRQSSFQMSRPFVAVWIEGQGWSTPGSATVTTSPTILPASLYAASITHNCFAKSMALHPLEAKAGPMGGPALALPAGTKSLTIWAMAAAPPAPFFDIDDSLRG